MDNALEHKYAGILARQYGGVLFRAFFMRRDSAARFMRHTIEADTKAHRGNIYLKMLKTFALFVGVNVMADLLSRLTFNAAASGQYQFAASLILLAHSLSSGKETNKKFELLDKIFIDSLLQYSRGPHGDKVDEAIAYAYQFGRKLMNGGAQMFDDTWDFVAKKLGSRPSPRR